MGAIHRKAKKKAIIYINIHIVERGENIYLLSARHFIEFTYYMKSLKQLLYNSQAVGREFESLHPLQ